jgi:hypothetical protein
MHSYGLRKYTRPTYILSINKILTNVSILLAWLSAAGKEVVLYLVARNTFLKKEWRAFFLFCLFKEWGVFLLFCLFQECLLPVLTLPGVEDLLPFLHLPGAEGLLPLLPFPGVEGLLPLLPLSLVECLLPFYPFQEWRAFSLFCLFQERWAFFSPSSIRGAPSSCSASSWSGGLFTVLPLP